MFTISNGILTVEISEKGAEVQSVKKEGKEYLYQGNEGWKRKAPILFPWAGRLRDFHYSIDGSDFSMAQHGFARDMVFSVVDQGMDYIILKIVSNEETKKIYPRDFTFYQGYRLLGDKLEYSTKIENNSVRTMFFGLGYHPGFIYNGKNENSFFDVVNEEGSALMKLGLTPEGSWLSEVPVPAKDHFNVNEMKEFPTMVLKGAKTITFSDGERTVEMDMGNFPFAALWQNNDDHFVCIEGWMNLPSAPDEEEIFETRRNIAKIAFEEVFPAACTYRFA